MVIYADVLIVINLLVNYFLLLITKRLLRVTVRRIRILCGAVLGGLYSLIIFAPEMPLAVMILFHLTAVGIIVAAAIPVHSLKAYLKAYAAFFAVNFGFGGAMLAVWLMFRPNGMVYQNGAVYFDISIQVLLGSTVFCYILFSIIFFLLKRKAPDNRLYTVVLQNKEKSIHTKALLDTGNSLSDGFSDTPVLVTTEHILNKLTSAEEKAFLRGDTPQMQDTAFRLIPYATVHGSGVLRGIVIDCVLLPKEGISVKKPVLVLSVEPLGTTEYEVILCNHFFERGEKSRAFQTTKNSVKN
ncbi:MAG: sigma-E processing peptidase SpoIIGA [Candidatus Fimenecus sp.]